MLREIFRDDSDRLDNVALVCPDVDFGLDRCLVRGGDTSELCRRSAGGVASAHTQARTSDLAGARLLVQALGVALLDDLQGRVDEDLHEAEARLRMELARERAVRAVRRDERGHGDAARVRKELRDLADAADVLVARALVEAEVLVQPEAHVVTVEAVAEAVLVQQVLLERARDGGLRAARSGLGTARDGPRRREGTRHTFPLALRPVSQMVTPFCFSSSARPALSTEPARTVSRLGERYIVRVCAYLHERQCWSPSSSGSTEGRGLRLRGIRNMAKF